jgi:hypothetical protein
MEGDQMKRLLLLIIAFCVTTPAYCGEITEIELPDLVGTYVWRDSKSSEFQFDRIPQTIYRMEIRIAGVVTPGNLYCEGGGLGLIGSLGMRFIAEIPDTIPDVEWVADHSIRPDGAFNWDEFEFDVTIEFLPRNGVTWDIVMDGNGRIDLISREAYYSGDCDPLSPFPSSIVTSAVLIVDADILVGTEVYSWGAIKQLMK